MNSSQSWTFVCQGCNQNVKQGSPGDLKCLKLDDKEDGELAQITVCSKCAREIDKWIEESEKIQAEKEKAKPPKVIPDRPGGYPAPVNPAPAIPPAPPVQQPLNVAPPVLKHHPPAPPEPVTDPLALILAELVAGQNRIAEGQEKLIDLLKVKAEAPFKPYPFQEKLMNEYGVQGENNRRRRRGRSR